MSRRAGASGPAFWGDADDGEARQRYQTLVNAIDDGVYHLDAEGRVVAVNDVLVDLTGRTRDDLVGESVAALFDGGDAEVIERELDRLSADAAGRSTRLDLTVRNANGGQVPCEVRLTSLEPDGALDGSVGIVREGDERSRAKRIAEESAETGWLSDGVERGGGREQGDDGECAMDRQRVVTALEAAREGVSLLDEDGVFAYVNGAYAETFGYDPDEMIGERWDDLGIEADPDRMREEIIPVVREKGRWAGTTTCVRSDGSQFRSQHSLVSTGGGELICLVRDVTDRTERERKLQRTERRFEAMFEDPNVLVGLLEPDGTVIDINETAMEYVDTDLSDVRGDSFWETPWWGEGVSADVREWTERAAAGEYVEFQADLTRPDGERYVLEGYFRPVTDEDGEVVSIIVSDRDVTERKERERQLKESERRYRTVVENFPNGAVGLVDRDLRYVTIGGHPLTESDLTADELVGRSIRDVLSPNLADHLVPVYQSALDGEPAMLEYEYDGGDRHTRFRAFPVRDDDGEVFGAMGMSQDITEQIERERRLEESERRYRTLAENFPNGAVAVYDEDLRFTLTRGAELGDVLPERTELEGRRVLDVFPPDIVADLEPLLRAAVEDGESDSDTFEFGGRHWRTRATPLRDADGEIFAGLSFSQDITEQVEREAELERALDLLERTERIADVGGWEVDPETRDVFWSEHIFDLLEVDADEEPPLEAALDMYHAADRPTVESAIDDALASGEPFDVEVRLRTAASGEVRWLRLQGVPETEDGDIETLRGAVQDVTERVEREAELEELIERLEESNERLEQFAYAASHDLQEPLRMVSSYLQLVEQRYAADLDEDGREFISYAVDGADRMREMIEGLLQYSRVDTRGDPFEPVDLDAVFADVRDDLQVRIEETGAEVTADDLPRVDGDPGQLRQVFQNLLDNAIEYSGNDSPRVHVSAERAGDRWKISVSDEGIGIDPDDAEQVFEVFQSLHSREDHAGTGIGLALCERIVERHDGDIRVDSEPGGGSTFTFTLPAIGEHSARP